MPLIDSDKWTAKFISLNQLHFHPANPRLPELRGPTSERQIVHELCIRGKVHALAKEIAEKGYFRNDRLIVFQDSRKFVVYEGNRRLCALKVLDNPDLAPPTMQSAFRRLAEKAKVPSKVAVEVVPTKFDAEVVMYAKHAGDAFVVNWDPLQQATFIAAKLEEGVPPDELVREHGVKREHVTRARASVDFFRIARMATLKPKTKELVDDPEKFPYSTVFERLIWPKKCRDALGIELSDDGLLVRSSPEAFLPVVARILDDAASDEINTRKLNSEEQQLAYIKSLGHKPGGGEFTAETLEAVAKSKGTTVPGAGAKAAAAAAARVKPARQSTRLFPRDICCEHHSEKLLRMIDEGKGIDISDAPHASAMLLRAVLEVSLNLWLKAKKVWHEARLLENNPKHGPSLATMLDYVNTNQAKFGFDPNVGNALSALVSRKVKQSKPYLDNIVHSPDVIATEENVIEIREQALPLLRVILLLSS